MDEKTVIDIEMRRTRLFEENEDLRARLEEAERTLDAIRSGDVDALVIEGADEPRVYTLEGSDFPYRGIVETMAAGAVTLDRDETILYCNAVFSAMTGIPIQRLIGSSFLDLMPAEHRDAFMGFIDRSQMENSHVELPLRTASGKELYVHLAGGCELHDVHTSCIVVTDITARKRAEEALEEAHEELEERVEARTRELRVSEARYRSLFDNMLDGFAYCEMLFEDGRPADFVYLEVNEAFERLTGLKDVVARKVSEIIPGILKANPELLEIYGRAVSTGRPERFEIDLKPLGMWFSISVYGTEKNRFVAVFHNITERKHAEEALREAHDELEQRVLERTGALARQAELLELAHGAILVRDLENRITFWNRGAEEVYGWTKAEALGNVAHAFLHTRFPTPFNEHIETLTREGRWEGELVHTTKDGRQITVLSRQALQRDAAGNPLAILEINLDITGRKQVEENLDIKSRTLEEVNTALKVLLKQREEDRSDLEENILSNVKELILPYVEKLKKSRLDAGQAGNVDILETNLREITSPIIRKLQSFDLTPREIEVVSHVKDGKTTKQIAELLGVSARAVEFHRYNIRKKLGLEQKRSNLRSRLRSIT